MKLERGLDRVRIRYFSTLDTRAVAVRAALIVLFLVLIPAVCLALDVPFPFLNPVVLVVLLVGITLALGVEPHRIEADREIGIHWDVPSRRGTTSVAAPSELHLVPEDRGTTSDGRVIVSWQVRAEGPEGDVVAEKTGAEVEMAEVASELARFYGVPFVQRLPDGRDVRLATSDLDLPLRERLRRFPRTLGPLPSPTPSVEIEDEGGRVTYRWGALTPATGVLLLALWALSWLYLTWPVQVGGGVEREALWAVAWDAGDWRPFAVTVLPALVLSLLAVWWTGSLTLGGDEVRLGVKVLVPVRRRTVPLSDLRDACASGVRLVLLTRTGRAVAFFFDFGSSRSARFVAADLRYRLAGGGPAEEDGRGAASPA